MAKIEMEVAELEQLLKQQKQEVAEYITRNLSCYQFYQEPLDITKAKEQMREQANNAKYPHDFNVLKKYVR